MVGALNYSLPFVFITWCIIKNRNYYALTFTKKANNPSPCLQVYNVYNSTFLKKRSNSREKNEFSIMTMHTPIHNFYKNNFWPKQIPGEPSSGLFLHRTVTSQ
jgi:hypothetical protein